jgi:monoterpene epsilon-lactone hydrolase
MASLQARFLDRLVRRLHLFGEDGADIATLRARVERTAPPVLPWAGVRVVPVRAGGVTAEWLTPKHAAKDRVLLYLHGGAWVMGSPRTHRALVADLARRAGVRALSLDYRLAPEHPYPAALDDAVAAYDWLLASGIEPGRIVVAGDSAGGNLALALLLRLRDVATPLPAGAVLLSPVTDLELGGASHATRKALDPFFAKADLRPFIAPYVGAHDPHDPYLSPLGADLHGLPPLLVHVGDHEVLLDDAVRLGERAREAGVEERTVVWSGMMHVFQIQALFLPEARRANREIAAFIRSKVGLPA